MSDETDYRQLFAELATAARIGGGVFWPRHIRTIIAAVRKNAVTDERLEPVLARFHADFVRLASSGTPEAADRNRKAAGAYNKQLNSARGKQKSLAVDAALLEMGLDAPLKIVAARAGCLPGLVSKRKKHFPVDR